MLQAVLPAELLARWQEQMEQIDLGAIEVQEEWQAMRQKMEQARVQAKTQLALQLERCATGSIRQGQLEF